MSHKIKMVTTVNAAFKTQIRPKLIQIHNLVKSPSNFFNKLVDNVDIFNKNLICVVMWFQFMSDTFFIQQSQFVIIIIVV